MSPPEKFDPEPVGDGHSSIAPAAAGLVNGGVSIASNATNSPSAITLSGTGVAAAVHSVALSWTASSSTVSGYNVYRGTTAGRTAPDEAEPLAGHGGGLLGFHGRGWNNLLLRRHLG